MNGTHSHDHGVQEAGHRRPLAKVLAISATILVVEVVGAVVSGSLALLADAGHMLTDVAGLSLAMAAAVLAERPATDARTWGYRRAEVLAAAAQAAVLLAVGGVVLVEGVRRLVEPPSVSSGVMTVFGAVSLLGNAVSILLLRRVASANLNLRAALLEVVNDALGAVAVLAAAAVIAFTGWLRADAVASLLIGALILPRTWNLLRETVDVLMEATRRASTWPTSAPTSSRWPTSTRSTTCTRHRSRATCRYSPRTSWSTTRASTTGTCRSCWTSCSAA